MRRPGDAERPVLVVRLDGAGDVLLAGPCVRAVAAGSAEVVMLVGPQGREAARLLPGVGRLLVWEAPWVLRDPPPVSAPDVARLAARIRAVDVAEALVLTSFHQSPLPTALVLRMAGVPRISAVSTDYPGSLLDVRHCFDAAAHETERALALAAAAGFPAPPGDDGRLAVRGPLPETSPVTGTGGYVVAHPGATAQARRWPPARWTEAVRELGSRGHRVVVTGSRAEGELTRAVAGRHGIDLGGRLRFAELAGVLARARAVLVGNTGPAHLAAAVGTPVVSLFAPVVPARWWRPYGVRHVLLGDQDAPCRGSRAVACPVPGHPCLTDVTAAAAADAVEELISEGSER